YGGVRLLQAHGSGVERGGVEAGGDLAEAAGALAADVAAGAVDAAVDGEEGGGRAFVCGSVELDAVPVWVFALQPGDDEVGRLLQELVGLLPEGSGYRQEVSLGAAVTVQDVDQREQGVVALAAPHGQAFRYGDRPDPLGLAGEPALPAEEVREREGEVAVGLLLD